MAQTKCLGFLLFVIGFILFFIYPGYTVAFALYMAAYPGSFMKWDILLPDVITWAVGLILMILGPLFYVEISVKEDRKKIIGIVFLVLGLFLTIVYPGDIMIRELMSTIPFGYTNMREWLFVPFLIFWIFGVIMLISSIPILIKVYGTKALLKRDKKSKKELDEDLEKIEVSADIKGSFAPNTCPKCGGWFPQRMWKCDICGYERKE